MRHAIRSTALLAVICGHFLAAGVQGDQTPAQPAAGPPPKAASDNRLTTISGFTVDYPKSKDWQMLGGVGSALVVFYHSSRQATVAIERVKLEVPQKPEEITDLTAKLEIEEWQLRRPLAYGFSAPKFIDPGRTILVDFNQPGPQGVEHVRLYTSMRGLDRFRVVCTTPEPLFTKYMDACHRIAISLYPAATAP
jgi:hypothetical protein